MVSEEKIFENVYRRRRTPSDGNSSYSSGIIGLFSSKFQNFNTFRPLFQKLLEIDVKFKLQTCSASQDIPTLEFLAHLYELLPSLGVRRRL
jgi:hypothetical protein